MKLAKLYEVNAALVCRISQGVGGEDQESYHGKRYWRDWEIGKLRLAKLYEVKAWEVRIRNRILGSATGEVGDLEL